MNNSSAHSATKSFSLQSLASAKNLILGAKEVVLLCHKNADADTAGCAIAMAKILQHLGKHFRVIYPDAPGYKDGLTFDYERIGTCDIQPDLCMGFDSPTLTRFYWQESFSTVPMIAVDHHTGFDIPATEQFVDTAAASACEVLAKIIFAWDSQWLAIPGVAQVLLEGQLSDSHTFRTEPSNTHSLEVAIILINMGADFVKAKKAVAKLHKPDNLKFLGQIIANGSFDQEANAFSMICDEKTLVQNNVKIDTLQGLVSIVSQMIDCDVTIFAYQSDSTKTKCSLRSKTTDVAAICKSFGGGGHKLASGFEKTDTSCQEVVSMVIKRMREVNLN